MKYTEIELAAIEQYAPDMPKGAEERIMSRTLNNIRTKRKPCAYHNYKRTLAVACVLVLLTVSAVAANATFDLTGLYEPFVGERGAQYLQGINKTDTNDGIELSVDAVCTDGTTVMVFYTLTDIEGKGRLRESMSMNSYLDYWPGLFTIVEYFTWIGGSGGNGPLEIADDGNSGRYWYTTTQKDGIAPGRLMVFRLHEFKTGFQSSDRSWKNEMDGEWIVTFRMEAGFNAEPYTLGVTLPNGLKLDTITLTPISAIIRGTGNYEVFRQMMDEYEFSREVFDEMFELVSASGQSIVLSGAGSSATTEDGGRFTIERTGILPDDITAIRVDGVEYPLE